MTMQLCSGFVLVTVQAHTIAFASDTVDCEPKVARRAFCNQVDRAGRAGLADAVLAFTSVDCRIVTHVVVPLWLALLLPVQTKMRACTYEYTLCGRG